MPGLLSDVDPDGLLEYSVVFTDRSLNHMSQRFQRVMCDIQAFSSTSTTHILPLWCPAAAPMAWKPSLGNLPLARSAW